MSYQLLIFDCDGVLVDSEPIYDRVLRDALAPLGLVYTTEEVVATFVGKTWASSRAMIQELLGGALPDEFEAGLAASLKAALRAELRPIPGVVEVIEQMTLPFCVASNGQVQTIRSSLEVTGLLPHFEGKIFSAAHVGAGKPAPDLFLHAAATMGYEPAVTVVVEDTVVGVEAAVAAGMDVLGYAGTFGAEALASAGARVFSDMAEIPALVRQGKKA